jgi:hypothetical protein
MYRVSSTLLAKEKFKYLLCILSEWAEIFTMYTGVFIVHKSNVFKKRFKVFATKFNKELNLSPAVKKTIDLFSWSMINGR